MYGAKKKTIGGKDYLVVGGTIERKGFTVVKKTYSTYSGEVVVERGKVYHPNGEVTPE